MTTNEKCIAELGRCGITAAETNGTVYVVVDEVYLELAQYEIDFRARLWDETA